MAAPSPANVNLKIRAPLERADLPGLFQRTCTLLEAIGAEVLICEVSEIGADAVSIDALARLALAAQRRKCRVRLCGASSELRALVELVGLAGVLPG
jgi:ABC-type transporter Mla MlaB component